VLVRPGPPPPPASPPLPLLSRHTPGCHRPEEYGFEHKGQNCPCFGDLEAPCHRHLGPKGVNRKVQLSPPGTTRISAPPAPPAYPGACAGGPREWRRTHAQRPSAPYSTSNVGSLHWAVSEIWAPWGPLRDEGGPEGVLPSPHPHSPSAGEALWEILQRVLGCPRVYRCLRLGTEIP